MGVWKRLFKRAKANPSQAVPGAVAALNGLRYRAWFALAKPRVKIGAGLRVYGKLVVRGPGRVEIGQNCFIDSKIFRTVSIMTVNREARVVVGDDVGFNGTAVQCHDRVEIGDVSNLADAYIVDSPAHALSADRRSLPSDALPTAPVKIGRNVWVSCGCVILHGVEIGENSVVGAMSLVRKSLPPNGFYAGAPARFVKPVPPTFDDLDRSDAGGPSIAASDEETSDKTTSDQTASDQTASETKPSDQTPDGERV